MLAIAAMTFQHHNWCGCTLVANRATRAAASERNFHVHSLCALTFMTDKRCNSGHSLGQRISQSSSRVKSRSLHPPRYWWVLLEFRNCGIHLVPRLRVGNENVHLRPKPARIVKASCQNSHKRRITSFKFASSNPRPAFGTKSALMFPESNAGRKMVAQLSARQSKCLSRKQHPGSESGASPLLTIATMAFEHHDRLRTAFVSNRAAGTATSKRYFHIYCFG